jgi:hypothetical protein
MAVRRRVKQWTAAERVAEQAAAGKTFKNASSAATLSSFMLSIVPGGLLLPCPE